MKAPIRSPLRRAILIIGSAALGAAVLGIRFMFVGADEVPEPGIAIWVRPVWMLAGALLGGALAALFVYRGRLSFKNKLPTRPPTDAERFTWRTVGLLVGSILLAVCLESTSRTCLAARPSQVLAAPTVDHFAVEGAMAVDCAAWCAVPFPASGCVRVSQKRSWARWANVRRVPFHPVKRA
jgi:hypothetical protein